MAKRVSDEVKKGGGESDLLLREALIEGVTDKEKRIINVSFSSEEAIEDWPNTFLVLGHTREEVDLDRLNKNGPVLMSHCYKNHVGCVLRAWLDEKAKKCYAEVKIARTQEANEVWSKIEDGILTGISVGTKFLSVELTSEKDGVRCYRATKWRPHEISLTPVPADLNVGVGREFTFMGTENDDEKMNGGVDNESSVSRQAASSPPAGSGGAAAQSPASGAGGGDAAAAANVGAEAARALSGAEIGQISRIGREYGFSAEALDAIENRERPDAFAERCLKIARGKSAGNGVSGDRDSKVGLNDKEVSRFSVARLVRAQAFPNNKRYRDEAGFELECVRALGHEEGSSVAIPSEVLRSWGRREAGAVNSTAVGGMVEDHLMMDSFVGMMRNQSDVLKRVSMRTGLKGNYAYPVQAANTKASWTGIDKPLSKTDVKIDKRAIVPSKLGAILEINESALIYAAMAVEQDLRRDITEAIAEEMQRVIFYGSGAGDEPGGLSVETGINKVQFAAANPTFKELTAMHTKIKKKLAARGNLFYAMGSDMEGHFLTSPRENGLNQPILSEPGSLLCGRAYESTELINEGHIFFGNFSEVFVGVWDNFKIDVNPHASGKWESNAIMLKAYQIAGVAVRRPGAFCFGSV